MTATTKTTSAKTAKLQAAKTAKLQAAKARAAKARAAKARAAKARAHKLAEMPSVASMATKMAHQLHVYRAGAVTGAMRNQSATRLYAAALLREFGNGFWLVASQKGKLSDNEAALRKNVRAEQRACKELAASRGLTNVYKPWSDTLAILKNPDGKRREAATKRPALARIDDTILAAFKIAYTNYEEFEDDSAYIAVYEALEKLCAQRKISTKAITDKQ